MHLPDPVITGSAFSVKGPDVDGYGQAFRDAQTGIILCTWVDPTRALEEQERAAKSIRHVVPRQNLKFMQQGVPLTLAESNRG